MMPKDTLEQRCKQLELVAREMLMFIGESATLKHPCDMDAYIALAKQLEEAKKIGK